MVIPGEHRGGDIGSAGNQFQEAHDKMPWAILLTAVFEEVNIRRHLTTLKVKGVQE